MNELNDQEFENLIRSAMKSRNEPGEISNLAEVVLTQARAHRAAISPQASWLARQSRWNRIITAAAAVLILVVLIVGIHQLKAVVSSGSDQTDTTTSTATATSSDWLTDTFGSSNQSMTGTEFAWIGACVVIVSLTILVVLPSTSSRQQNMIGF